MANFMDITTIIFLVVAIVIFIRLRSVLGTRTGHERPSPLQEQERRAKEEANTEKPAIDVNNGASIPDNVVSMPERQGSRKSIGESFDKQAHIKKYANDNDDLAGVMNDLMNKDSSLRFDEFLKGASSAYEMIVTAFADEDLKMLKNLLSKDVYESFASVIADRQANKLRLDYAFVGFKSVDIADAQLDKNTARITVRFKGESVSATKNEAGDIVEGDESRVEEFADMWTFARSLKSSDPNWKLVGTSGA